MILLIEFGHHALLLRLEGLLYIYLRNSVGALDQHARINVALNLVETVFVLLGSDF